MDAGRRYNRTVRGITESGKRRCIGGDIETQGKHLKDAGLQVLEELNDSHLETKLALA
jgi:hypothetical protein